MDTPLSNSCCTFSFGMSFDRLFATARDRKLVSVAHVFCLLSVPCSLFAVILQSLPCLLLFSLTGRLTVSNVPFSLQVVSLRSKDRFQEQEVGLVTIPLQDVVESEPQYFRCRDTGKVRDNTSSKLNVEIAVVRGSDRDWERASIGDRYCCSRLPFASLILACVESNPVRIVRSLSLHAFGCAPDGRGLDCAIPRGGLLARG